MNQKAIVTLSISAVLFWLFLGIFVIIPWQVAGVLVAISVGIASLLLNYERGKTSESINQTRPEIELKPQKDHEEHTQFEFPKSILQESKDTFRTLLPDVTDTTNLKIDNSFLDQLYENAHSKAIKTYSDAKLSSFCIQAIPFDKTPSINIYFDFYSKWTDRICRFQYSSLTSDLKHYTPNKTAKLDFDRKTLDDLPWRNSPHFLQALSKAYDKIKPLPSVEGTYYSINMSGYLKNWHISFEDGLSGNEHKYDWNGGGLDENSIIEVT